MLGIHQLNILKPKKLVTLFYSFFHTKGLLVGNSEWKASKVGNLPAKGYFFLMTYWQQKCYKTTGKSEVWVCAIGDKKPHLGCVCLWSGPYITWRTNNTVSYCHGGGLQRELEPSEGKGKANANQYLITAAKYSG